MSHFPVYGCKDEPTNVINPRKLLMKLSLPTSLNTVDASPLAAVYEPAIFLLPAPSLTRLFTP
jgi:hypothetical protein